MSRDSKGNTNKDPSHVRLYVWMMSSPAWQALSADGRALYVLLKVRYNGRNNGHLALSTRQAGEALHMSKNTAALAFKELQARGFIEVSIRGSFGGRKDGRATEYRLTEHVCDRTGELPSKKFMRWRPEEDSTGISERTASPSARTVSPSARTVKHAYP